MPYTSIAQMRYMHSQHPEIAKRWDKKYDTPSDIPEKLSFGKRKNKKKDMA